MTMRTRWKRITSWVLILAMVFTMLPGRITTVHAAEGFYTVPKSQLALGANVIPNVLAGNKSFLDMYVRTDGKSMNVNSAFITQSTNDISNAGSHLSRVKMGREKNGNGQWGAEFKMTIPEKLRSSSYELRLEAKVKADYHKNVFYNAYNHWDVGYADIYGHQRLTAEKARDGEWQEVSASKTCNNFSWNNWEVTYKVGHEPGAGCECGSSAVTGSTFYIVKTSAPVIKDTYITTDVNGNNKVSGGFSFGNNNSIKAYVVLEFSEDIRFSDNSGEKLTLNLDAYYTKNNQSVDKSILKATLVSMASNKMIFEFSVPNKIGGSNTDIYIDGISGQQSFIGGDFNLVIYDKDGNKFECGNYTVDNYITDLAGNPLNWSGSDKSTGRVYFDNVNPTMTNISMTGNMITNESNGTQDSWDDGKDRSAVFAGVGDWVSFNVSFSEYMKGFDVNNVKAFLTITDQNGAAVDETIKLGADSYRNNTISFNRLTITESMKNAGTRIVITGFEGLGSVTDEYGNVLAAGNEYTADLTSVTMAPSQGIYLDVDAPIIATVADTNDLPVTNGVYTPYPSNEGEYFTFPLIISEDVSNTTLANTSQIDTLPAEFAIVMAGGAGDKKAFSWYVDTNKSIDANVVWKNGNTGTTEEEASKNTFYPVHDQINYVHIKLDPNVDYNYSSSLTTNNGVYFEGTIHAYARDHAGNSSTAAFKVKHQVDTAAPKVELVNKADLRVDYATTEGTLTTSFKVSDNYAIKSIKYNWIYTVDGGNETTTEPVTITLETTNGMTKEYQSGDILRKFFFEANGDAGRKGTAKLTVTVEDYAGRSHEMTSEEFSYDFTKTVPVNIVKTGTAQEPLLAPEVYILEPNIKGTDAGAANSRTVMFIKTGKNEDGTYTYWGYDPRDPGKYGDTRFDVNYAPNLDIIADMMSYTYKYGEEINMQAPGFWFSVTGEINDGAGTFETEGEGVQVYVSGSDYSALQEVIKNCYGQLEIICVTSSDFDTSNYYYNLRENHYNFKSATSIVETYTCYLGNNAVYQPAAIAVKDAEGQDAEDKLYYDAGEVPASNLDNVAITIKLENITTGEETMGYDLAQFDETKSWIELHYFGSSSGGYSSYYSENAIYAWPMVKAHEQTVVIPAGVADQIGWYGIYVITCNANGTETQTKLDKFFFMDPVTLEMSIDSYYKEYQYTYSSGENNYTQEFTVRKDAGLNESTKEVVELALGTGPNEKWNVDTSLYFTRTQRTYDDSNYGVQELLKARVYNKADTDYEQNAIWVDANDYGSYDYFKYTPVCVENITKESYGTAEALVLPLYKGDNIICMEVMNTNGIITSKEKVIYVTMPYEGVVFEKNITEVSERTGGIMEVNVEAQLPADVDPVQERYFTYGEEWLADGQSSVLGCTPSPYTNGVFKSAYTFRDDIDKEFWLLDQNGNLYAEHIIIEDIDGEAPFNVTMIDHNQNYDPYDGYVFEFTLTVQDKDGYVNGDEVTITFDKDYSAVLLGLTGEERTNNETQVTMSIPINREKDAAGEYIPWESYATNNNGIFRTQLISEYATDAATEDDQAFAIIVWGTFKHDKEYELYNNSSREVTMTVTALDTNGNVANNSISYEYKGNMQYSLNTGSITGEGAFNFYEPLDAEGNLGIYSRMPFSMIHSYGAGPQTEALYEYVYQSGYCTTAPMIQQDGIYIFDVTDLFGEHYELPLTVDVFDNLGVDISFSETAATNQDVTVYATATLAGDYITDINGVTESGAPISGTVDATDPAKASITLPENGTVIVKTYLDKERTVPILNIDKVLEPAEVIFYTPYGDELTGNETEVDYAVTAQVICDEVLYGTNGTLYYDFPRGSKAGDTYTFAYQDAADNEGSITAVLPCDISPIPGEYVDETAPQLMVSAYGMRNQKYNFIADVMNPDGTELSKNVNCYAAQEYRMILMIQDESDTKVVIQKPGEAAPTSYSTVENGSAVENVALADNTITISENVVFDLYILDENNNVTALTGVTITGVDKTGVEYYVDYQPGFDEDGLAIVTATFLPLDEGDELTPITVLDKTLSSRLMQTSQLNPEYDEEYDDPSEKYLYAERYYYVFKDNGAYTFRYRDDIGNQAEVLSQVQSMSTAAAVVENVLWYGTKGNVEPDKSSAVNKDVTADLTMSKAVSEVTLYKYNSEAENGLGDVLSADAPIEVSFTAKSVYVTYTDNVDYKIAIQFKAAESGRNGCYVLPEVMCIDKTAPVVTLVSAVSSANNRSMAITFKTDEATLLPENYAVGYTKEHTWMVTDNQPKELRFSDKAGNITTYNLTDNAGLDVTYLTVDYSAIGNDADATKDAINDLKVDVGEDIYIKTNKKATVKLDDTDQGTVEADIWTKLTLPDSAGVHILQLVDVSTGELFYDNVAAQPKDNIPPEIKLASNSIVLLEGSSVESMMQKIKEGVTITDNKDGAIADYTIEGYPNATKAGLFSLTYKALDADGNQTNAYRTLYIMKAGTPLLMVNGEAALPYGRTVIRGNNVNLEVTGMGTAGEALVIKWRSGMKTTAQMKHSTTTVQNMEFQVPESGFYTIYVRTQDRMEYVTYLYVEE